MATISFRANVHTEMSLPVRLPHRINNRLRHILRVRILRLDKDVSIQDALVITLVRSFLVLSIDRLVIGRCSVGEMAGPLASSSWHDDGGFDAPESQLACIADSKRIHAGLGCEIGAKIGRDTASGAA